MLPLVWKRDKEKSSCCGTCLWNLTPLHCDPLRSRLICALNFTREKHRLLHIFPWQTLLFLILSLDMGFAGCEWRWKCIDLLLAAVM